jgi:aspartate/methionine/tyrosine aminotransferase
VVSARVPHLTAKLQGFGTTIFAEMTSLAASTNSINLGQGFPDTDGPREVLDAAIAAINGGMNQYPPESASLRCDTRSLRTNIASTG